MFVGPPELDSEWDERGIDGVYRFITRFWKLAVDSIEANVEPTKEMINFVTRWFIQSQDVLKTLV